MIVVTMNHVHVEVATILVITISYCTCNTYFNIRLSYPFVNAQYLAIRYSLPGPLRATMGVEHHY